jgi:hypothetical protein
MNIMRHLLIIVGLALVPPLEAAEAPREARITRATTVHQSPASDAVVVTKLVAQERVTVSERSGGWYRIVAAGGTGWVRLSGVRFATTSSESRGGLAAPLRLLQSGRAAVTTGTVTTGVRGLTEQELAASTPDPAAVAALEAHAVDATAARAFANELELRPTQVKALKPPAGEPKSDEDDGEGGP